MIEPPESGLGDHQDLPDQRAGAVDALVSLARGRSKPDRCEGRLDGIRGPQVLPVLLREAEEGHHPLPIPLERLDRLRMRLPIARCKSVAQPLGLGLGFGVDNPTQQVLRLGLQADRQLIQHVDELVIPAALLFDLREDLGESGPDPEMAICNDESRCVQAAGAKLSPPPPWMNPMKISEVIELRPYGSGAP